MKICKRGHALTESNIIVYSSGVYKGKYKCCRDCKRVLANKWRKNNKKKIKKYRIKYKDKISAYNKEYNEKNTEYLRNRWIKRHHGITADVYDAIFEKQGYRCANLNCKTVMNTKNKHLDHCHMTGVIRGILCNKCNMALGLLQDDLNTIQGLLNYLEQFKN